MKLRFFAGLTAAEAAVALGLSHARPPSVTGPTLAPGSMPRLGQDAGPTPILKSSAISLAGFAGKRAH